MMSLYKSICFAFLLLSATLVFSGCTKIFYQPSSQMFIDPKAAGLNFDEVEFKTPDGINLQGWLFPAQLKSGQKPKGVFIQFHGNAENRSTHFLSLAWVIREGYHFFTFDYRGYGDSAGSPSQRGLHTDTLSAIALIRADPRTKSLPLILYGQSIGGTVLLRALADLKETSDIKLVVADSSFYSYKAIARTKLAHNWLTFLFQPLGWIFVSDEYSPEDVISSLGPYPKLVIHGKEDNVIPFEHGEKIFELATEPKYFWEIEKGRHIDSMLKHRGLYRTKLMGLLDSESKLLN